MQRKTINSRLGSWLLRSASLLFVLCLCLALATAAAAQKDKKKKKDDAPLPATPGNVIPLPDEQKIDYEISEMLGAWQVGDVDKLHKNIADDVVVVNGNWAPPVIGWDNYLTSYKMQRARAQQARLERTNTLIRVSGSIAWASYQWDFSAVVDGQPTTAQGQTTLVLQKRGDVWLVVHNHTSLVQSSTGAASANATPPATPPTKP
jgi:ketosteroid isomerase-like protein